MLEALQLPQEDDENSQIPPYARPTRPVPVPPGEGFSHEDPTRPASTPRVELRHSDDPAQSPVFDLPNTPMEVGGGFPRESQAEPPDFRELWEVPEISDDAQAETHRRIYTGEELQAGRQIGEYLWARHTGQIDGEQPFRTIGELVRTLQTYGETRVGNGLTAIDAAQALEKFGERAYFNNEIHEARDGTEVVGYPLENQWRDAQLNEFYTIQYLPEIALSLVRPKIDQVRQALAAFEVKADEVINSEKVDVRLEWKKVLNLLYALRHRYVYFPKNHSHYDAYEMAQELEDIWDRWGEVAPTIPGLLKEKSEDIKARKINNYLYEKGISPKFNIRKLATFLLLRHPDMPQKKTWKDTIKGWLPKWGKAS